MQAIRLRGDLLTEVTNPGAIVSYHYDVGGRETMMAASSQPSLSYTYYNDSQLNTIATTNAAANQTYDGDGRPSVLTVNNLSANKSVFAGYGYDIASRLISMSYTATGNVNLGDLTYAYDQDGRVLTKGGSLAAVTFPPTMAAVYQNTNQIGTWNGINATDDSANNLTFNPLTSDIYTWDSKNELSTINTGTSYLYDAHGRRDNVTSSGYTTSYLYNGVGEVQASSGAGCRPFSTRLLLRTCRGYGVLEYGGGFDRHRDTDSG